MRLGSEIWLMVVLVCHGAAAAQEGLFPLPRVLAPVELKTPKPRLLIDGRLYEANPRAGAEKERRLSPGVYLSAALAAAAGGVAWWSERRADRAYDRYMHAASIRRQQDQFRRAERFDRVAGAAFAAMEAGFVLTAYLIFF